ncbi:MAG: hypothetical protein FWD76_05030, partial [Firmicutes bacterium]|nr:hypothetical protein [Bacillota bacterium]
MKNICGVVLKTKNEKTNFAELKILGRTCAEWVAGALGECVKFVDFAGDESLIPSVVRGSVQENKPYTVVLFADTPLVTKKTVADAV